MGFDLHIQSRCNLFRYLPGSAILLVLLMMLAPSSVMAEYADVVLNKRAEKAGISPVIFPHWFHRMRFRCKVCHTELGFEMSAGANNMTMADIIDGKFCGICHNGKIAWGPQNCFLCHSGKRGLESGIQGGEVTGGPGRW